MEERNRSDVLLTGPSCYLFRRTCALFLFYFF